MPMTGMPVGPGMSSVALVTVILTGGLLASQAARHSDEITVLPGWDESLPSRMYAGYVDAGVDQGYSMHEHYFFVEAETDPQTAPLLLWSNGGPGASSFFGLFTELGPFYLSSASRRTPSYNKTMVPTLFLNDNRWTKVANILILNSPPPVGYSYCDPIGPSGSGTSCGSWNDTRTAIHNKIFVENWVKEFPEYLSNPWFLMGESYAGIYIPTLARAILEDESSPLRPLIHGMAIGDGCVGLDVLCGPVGGPFFDVEFLHGHGQFSDRLYSQIQATCTHSELVDGNTSKACNKVLADISGQVGGYYSYNLYDACWYENNLDAVSSMPPWEARRNRTYWGPPTPNRLQTGELRGALNDYACGGPSALFEWVKTPPVRAALHVAANANFFSGDNGVGFNYTLTERNLLPFYEYLALNTTVRVLVYNGDTDPGINSFVTQNWTSYIGEKFGVVEDWRPWTLDSCQYMGGSVTSYKGDFQFLTIRGSGHMVPTYKPKPALSFLTHWLQDKPFPRYNSTCSTPP